jgi:hypothetical protein
MFRTILLAAALASCLATAGGSGPAPAPAKPTCPR